MNNFHSPILESFQFMLQRAFITYKTNVLKAQKPYEIQMYLFQTYINANENKLPCWVFPDCDVTLRKLGDLIS